MVLCRFLENGLQTMIKGGLMKKTKLLLGCCLGAFLLCSCREKALQEAWRVHGGAAFCVDVLEKLPYDKDDETKTDYSEELTLLCRLWQEKLPDHEEVWRNRT